MRVLILIAALLSFYSEWVLAGSLSDACQYGHRNVMTNSRNYSISSHCPSISLPTANSLSNQGYVVGDPYFSGPSDGVGTCKVPYVSLKDCANTASDDTGQDGCYADEDCANDNQKCESPSGKEFELDLGKSCSDYCQGPSVSFDQSTTPPGVNTKGSIHQCGTNPEGYGGDRLTDAVSDEPEDEPEDPPDGSGDDSGPDAGSGSDGGSIPGEGDSDPDDVPPLDRDIDEAQCGIGQRFTESGCQPLNDRCGYVNGIYTCMDESPPDGCGQAVDLNGNVVDGCFEEPDGCGYVNRQWTCLDAVDDINCGGGLIINGVCNRPGNDTTSQYCPPDMHWDGKKCLNNGSNCPIGQVLSSGSCVNDGCPSGQQQVKGACVAIDCGNGQLVSGVCVDQSTDPQCPSSMYWDGSTCRDRVNKCPIGSTADPNGECVADMCPDGQYELGGLCLPAPAPSDPEAPSDTDPGNCAVGYHWDSVFKECARDDCPAGQYIGWNGVCTDIPDGDSSKPGTDPNTPKPGDDNTPPGQTLDLSGINQRLDSILSSTRDADRNNTNALSNVAGKIDDTNKKLGDIHETTKKINESIGNLTEKAPDNLPQTVQTQLDNDGGALLDSVTNEYIESLKTEHNIPGASEITDLLKSPTYSECQDLEFPLLSAWTDQSIKIQCEKFEWFKSLFGYFLYFITVYNIIRTIIRPVSLRR